MFGFRQVHAHWSLPKLSWHRGQRLLVSSVELTASVGHKLNALVTSTTATQTRAKNSSTQTLSTRGLPTSGMENRYACSMTPLRVDTFTHFDVLYATDVVHCGQIWHESGSAHVARSTQNESVIAEMAMYHRWRQSSLRLTQKCTHTGDGTKPTYWRAFVDKTPWRLKTDQIMHWLGEPTYLHLHFPVQKV